MHVTAGLLQQGPVGDLVDQRVPEAVLGARRRPRQLDETLLAQSINDGAEIVGRLIDERAQQSEVEAGPDDRRGKQRRAVDAPQAVEADRQDVLDGRGDGQVLERGGSRP